MRYRVMLLSASLACLPACGGLELNPLVNQARTVHFEQDGSKTLTVINEMLWHDKSHAAHELKLPAGTYALEAQDDSYFYMRSPAPLGFKDFPKGGKPQSRSIRGGVAIGKYTTRSVPAAGYIDGQESTRILIWKLGKDFLGREGKDWRKSF